MKTPNRFPRFIGLSIITIVTTAAVLTGCETLESLEERGDTPVIWHMAGDRMTIEAPFDKVWPELVDIMQQRGYADLESERETVRETYRTTVEREDRPRNKQLRETVDEGRGQITATTSEQKQVPFELIEEHEWDMSALDVVARLAGGEENVHLDLKGVEIEVRRRSTGELDWTEINAVFEALQSRFEDGE